MTSSCHHHHGRALWVVLLAGAMAWLPATHAGAQGPHLAQVDLTNDFVSGNDDLYTAAFGLTIDLGDHALRLGERMFTDLAAGTRHDESFLEARLFSHAFRRHRLTASAGVVRVGHGLFGEGFQNSIHDLLATVEYHLAYPDRTRWYSTARFVLDTPLVTTGWGRLVGRTTVFTAPGFRSFLQLSAGLEREYRLGLTTRTAIGAMANTVQSDLLEGRVESLLAAFELDVQWHHLAVSLARNTRGTRQGHITVSLRLAGHGASLADSWD